MNQEKDILTPYFYWTFKNIFSDEMIFKNFLTSIVDWEYGPIERIEFLDKDMLNNPITDKESKLNLKAIMQDGSIIAIEIQFNQQAHYVARVLYYWAKICESQVESSYGYRGLMPVIFINILRGQHPDISGKNPYHQYAFLNEKSYSKLTNKFSIHYIELGKFTQEWVDGDLRNNWLTFLKNPEEVAMHPHYSQEIEKALEHLKWLSQDPSKRAEYDARHKALLDRQEELLIVEEIGLQKK